MSRYAELVLAKGILGGRLKKIFLVVFCAACVQKTMEHQVISRREWPIKGARAWTTTPCRRSARS